MNKIKTQKLNNDAKSPQQALISPNIILIRIKVLWIHLKLSDIRIIIKNNNIIDNKNFNKIILKIMNLNNLAIKVKRF